MGKWEIIGLSPTDDEEHIKKAYLDKLNKFNPEVDPKGFMTLRRAYEEVMEEVRKKKNVYELSFIDFIDKIKEIYNDFSRRIDEKEWIRLLQYDICRDIEMENEICHSVLKFLMVHYLVPHEVLVILNERFKWTDNREELYELFSEEFINFIISNVLYEDPIRYQLFSKEVQGQTERIDHFLEGYLHFLSAVNQKDIEDSEDILDQLLAMKIEHIDFSIEQVKYALVVKEDIKEAWQKAQKLLVDHKQDFAACYWYVRVAKEVDINKTLESELPQLLRLAPKNGEVLKLAGDMAYEVGQYKEALDYYLSAKEKQIGQEEIMASIIKCHKQLAKYYIEQGEQSKCEQWQICQHFYYGECYKEAIEIWNNLEEKLKGSVEGLELAAQCYYLLGNYDESLECRKAILPQVKEKEQFANLYLEMGRIYEEKKDYEVALAYYEEAITQNTEQGINYYIKAKLLYQMNRLEEAFLDCKRAIELENEQIPYSLALMADIMYEYEQFEAVKEYCLKALRITYLENSFLLLLKVNYYQEHYEEVVELAERVLRQGGNSITLLFYYGCSLRELERYEEAEKILKSIEAQVSNKEMIAYELAELYSRMKDYSRALVYINQSISQGKMTNNKYFLKVNILMELGHYLDVISMINEQINATTPTMFEYYNLGRSYSKLGKYEEAIAFYLELLKLNDDNDYIRVEIGDCYQSMGKFTDAIKYYEEAIEKGKAQSYQYLRLIRVLRRTAQYEKATKLCQIALEGDPEEESYYLLMAKLYWDADDYEESSHFFSRYGEFEGNLGYAYSEMGECYIKLKQYEKAEAMFTASIEAEKDNSDGYFSFGKYYFEEVRDYVKAVHYLEEAYTIDNDNAYYALYVGKAYEKLNDIKRAKRYFNISLQIALNDIEDDPQKPCNYEAAAEAYVCLGEYEKVREFAYKAIEKGPSYFYCPGCGCFEGYEDIAKHYRLQGEYEKAISAYEKGLEFIDKKSYKEEIAKLYNLLKQ